MTVVMLVATLNLKAVSKLDPAFGLRALIFGLWAYCLPASPFEKNWRRYKRE